MKIIIELISCLQWLKKNAVQAQSWSVSTEKKKVNRMNFVMKERSNERRKKKKTLEHPEILLNRLKNT